MGLHLKKEEREENGVGRDQTWRLLKLRDSLKRCDGGAGGCEFSKFELIEEIKDGSGKVTLVLNCFG